VIVYLETSALLRWLLGTPDEAHVLEVLRRCERVIASRLTALEARRALLRCLQDRTLDDVATARARTLLEAAQADWTVMDIVEPVCYRAEERFPAEPIRALDAIHLATALRFRETLGVVAMLSYDRRVRDNWRALGLPLA
jgi:predicted nucleic acid-binding protein